MKKVSLLVLSIFIFAIHSYAQKFNGVAKGVLQDSVTATPLADATVSIVRTKDSSLISFTITTSSGFFEIKNIAPGTYHLIASYTGMQGLKKEFTISENNTTADFGTIKLGRNYKSLTEVVVTDNAPVKVKGDTVEFRAESFKSVKPNATVEDLLKKVPGMEVDKDGTVKSQGEQVQKVYVDGKEFFGNDPKLATKNISQDMVESIQVYDDMSEQAKFTQMDDGSRSKTINIKLKKDKKNGVFGRAMAGVGTNDRYQSSLSVNRFVGNRQISVIGSANNLDKQGFSFSDVVGGMGMGSLSGNFGGGGMMIRGGGGGFGGSSGGSGISAPMSLGFNYRDTWGSKVDVSGSLFGSRIKTILDQSRLRSEVPIPDLDSSILSDSRTRSNSLNENLRFNMRLEYKIDSANSLLYYPSITFQNSESYSFDSTGTLASINNEPYYTALTQKRINDNSRDGYSMNQNLLFRHRFSKKGRTLTLGITSTLNESKGEGTTYSPYNYYTKTGDIYRSQLLDQQSNQTIEGFNNTISTSYTEPIGRNKMLELNYAYTNNQSTSDKKTFDMDPMSGKYEVLNAPLTNYFENGYISHRIGANFRVQQRKYNYQLGIGEQINSLSSRSVRAMNNKDTTAKQSFVNLYPTANFNYNFTRGKSLRFRYSGRTNQPSISQLQDVPDYTNPLQVKTGNPLLKQEFTNSFNLNYNTFNMVSFRYFSANLSFSQTANKIVNSQDTISKGVTLVKPINMNGTYSGNGFITLGLPFKNPKLKGSTFNSTTMASYGRNVSMLFKQVNYTRNLMLTQTEGINYTYKEKIDVGLRASISYNMTRYDSLLKRPNTDYWSQTYSADVTFNLPKNFVLQTDFDYYLTTGQAEGYNRNIPLLNASLSKLMFKNKAGQLKMEVHDIFNQNQSLTRNTGANYFEDVRTNVIQRYFMLSFTYSLNRMGGKNMMQQVPGMFRRGAPPPPPPGM
jgi:hypothetical protein